MCFFLHACVIRYYTPSHVSFQETMEITAFQDQGVKGETKENKESQVLENGPRCGSYSKSCSHSLKSYQSCFSASFTTSLGTGETGDIISQIKARPQCNIQHCWRQYFSTLGTRTGARADQTPDTPTQGVGMDAGAGWVMAALTLEWHKR